MSTLRVNTIENLSGAAGYPAAAWVNFNGTGTVSIRASGNVSSITDHGVGDYTANFTTSLGDASYSATLSSAVNDTTAGVVSPIGAAPSATSLRMKTYGATFVATDSLHVYLTVHR